MTHEIKASWDTLMQQSKDTTWGYFSEAHKILDGSDLKYTAADVVALTAVMATDFHTASMGVAAQKLSEAVASVGEELSGISESLSGIDLGLDSGIDGIDRAIVGLSETVSNLRS